MEEFINWTKQLCNYDNYEIFDPSKYQDLLGEAVNMEILLKLKREGSYLARSSDDDVARLEKCTFVCTDEYNGEHNWKNTSEMKNIVLPLFKNCMKNKKIYLVPFVMGDVEDKYSLFGLMVTDSLYVVLNMNIMTKTGYDVLDKIRGGREFVKCLHSVGSNPKVNIYGGLKWESSKEKYICNFQDEDLICSYGSNYGGNAILSKKCMALRYASYVGWKDKDNGWFAEHMMLISLENKRDGKKIYIAGAFPSACGKTNMAMLRSYDEEWEIKTLGDDITWLRVIDGKLYGMNPEGGFFGVAPNTSTATNPVCIETISKNTLFTNVGLTTENDVCWQGMDKGESMYDAMSWQGKIGLREVAHPNSRFTVKASQCPQWDHENEKKWVPISAIIFGGRRGNTNIPVIRESKNFEHGIMMGATLSSETTAAAESPVGKLRYDPFAMLPFIGYSYKNYLTHWLELENRLTEPLKFYYINLFGKIDGKFVWPGYSHNINLLKWIYERVNGTAGIVESNIGGLPELSYGIFPSYEINDEFWNEQYKLDREFMLSINAPETLLEEKHQYVK